MWKRRINFPVSCCQCLIIYAILCIDEIIPSAKYYETIQAVDVLNLRYLVAKHAENLETF